MAACTPYPKPPQVACPGRFLPPHAGLPAATLSPGRTQESLLRREHNPYPSFIPQSHQGPWKPPTTQGQTSQLLARPHSASRFPHAKLIKIGFLQSPSAHSKPHAPPHHSPPSEGGWKRRANTPTPTTRTGIPERGDKRAAEEGAEWPAPEREASWRGREEGARRPRPPGCTHLSTVGRALHSHLLPRVRQLRQRHLPTRPTAFTASSLPTRPAAGPTQSPPEPHGSGGGSSSSGGSPGKGSASTPTLEHRALSWRRPRAKREPRAAARHRVSPLSSSPPSAAGTTAPPPAAGSRARSQQNSSRRALPHFRSQHGA